MGQRIKNDVLWGLARGALWAVTLLPRRAVGGACALLAMLVHATARSLRDTVRRRLEAGRGSAPDAAAVRAVFLGAGALLADTIALLDPNERADRTLRLPDASRRTLAAAFAEGRGVVFVTAHLGPWERMAALLAAEGFVVTTVARESYDPRFTRLYERLRAPRGVRSVWRGHPGVGRQVVRELRAGRAVGTLIDLPGRSPALCCSLFGSTARVATGPARLALGFGAAVVLGTPVPTDDGGYELYIERVRCTEQTSVEELTRGLADALTSRVAMRPEAWLGLFHGVGGSD